MTGEKGLAYLWQAREAACVMTLDDWLEKDRLSIPVLGSDFSLKIMNKIQLQGKQKNGIEKRGFQQAINN